MIERRGFIRAALALAAAPLAFIRRPVPPPVVAIEPVAPAPLVFRADAFQMAMEPITFPQPIESMIACGSRLYVVSGGSLYFIEGPVPSPCSVVGVEPATPNDYTPGDYHKPDDFMWSAAERRAYRDGVGVNRESGPSIQFGKEWDWEHSLSVRIKE